MPHSGILAPDTVRDFGEEFKEVTSTSVTGNKRALDGYNRNPTSNPVSVQDFKLEVAKGNVPGHEVVFVSGENKILDSTFQTVWPVGGNYTRSFAASNLNLSSASANDTLLGTGARKVLILGVIADYVETSEIVEMDGQTPVATVNNYIAINSMIIVSGETGALGFNDGRIYVSTGALTNGVPAVATTYHVMEANDSLSRSSVYTVPAGFCMFLVGAATSVDANKDVIVRLKLIDQNQLDVTGFPFNITNISVADNIAVPSRVPEKTIIETQAKDVDAADVSLTFTYIRIESSLVSASSLKIL